MTQVLDRGQADEIREHLEAEVAEGIFATGGQLYVSLDGLPVIDLAVGVDGVDNAVTRDTLFAVYCAGKPVLAVALGCLVDDGELSFDDRLGDVVDDPPVPAALADVRIGHLLSHTAGLHGLLADAYIAVPSAHHDELVLSLRPPQWWEAGKDLAYSEVAAWHLLGRVLENLTGESVRGFVDRRILEPAELGGELVVGGMRRAEFEATGERLGVNVWLDGPQRDPLLLERTWRLRGATNPAVGSSASARGLGRFYEALLRIHSQSVADDASGETGPRSDQLAPATLRALTSISSSGFDRVMSRRCCYGLGFMVRLTDHSFGSLCSPASFGHSGNGGMTAAFCDPVAQLVVAYHFNGRIDAESAVMFRRPSLIDRIYRVTVGED